MVAQLGSETAEAWTQVSLTLNTTTTKPPHLSALYMNSEDLLKNKKFEASDSED